MGMLLRRNRIASNQHTEGAVEKTAPEVVVEVKAVEEKPAEVKEEPKLKRSDIMKMTVAELRKLAKEQGIKGAEAMSGTKLKQVLVDKLLQE